MTRYSAFAIHLGISFLIFLVLAYMIVFVWYPGILFDTDGGWRGMQIIVAVDLVLGPLLTLIVYKAGKPGLRTDLTLIGLLQFICLSAGTFVVYDERPIAVVYNDGRFSVMTRDDYVEAAGVEVPDLRHFPGDNPKWVIVEIPEGTEAEADFRARAARSGRLINSFADFYAPFSIDHPQFRSNAMDPGRIGEGKKWRAALDRWVSEHGGQLDEYAFYTFSTRYTFGYLVYDKKSNAQLGLLTSERDV